MTEFTASQISAEVQNVDLVENIGGNLLQGISNSLSASAKKAAVFEKQNTVVEKKSREDTNTDSTRKQVLMKSLCWNSLFQYFFDAMWNLIIDM